jgi:hypothetical protein
MARLCLISGLFDCGTQMTELEQIAYNQRKLAIFQLTGYWSEDDDE